MTALAVRQVCRRATILCLAGIVLYIALAAVASVFPEVEHAEGVRFWPAFLPDWPIAFLGALAATFAVGDVALWALARSAASGERERRRALALEWPSRAEARRAVTEGDQSLALRAFRAQALAGGARLAWIAPARTYDRVVVLRSRQAFAHSPHPATHQAVAYEGEDTDFVDEGLAPDCVYFYTGFAEARGAGEWSPPAWAYVATPAQRLRDVALCRLWTLRR